MNITITVQVASVRTLSLQVVGSYAIHYFSWHSYIYIIT